MENNLNQDALSYSEGLQAYQQGLIQKSQQQAKLDQQAKDNDAKINDPLNFVTDAAMAKPIKGIITKAKEGGVKWVKGKIRSKLGELGDRIKGQLPEGTSLEDVIKGEKPVIPEDISDNVREGINKLRSALGKKPLKPSTSTQAPAKDEPDSTDIGSVQESADTSAPEYNDFPADSAVRNQPKINLKGIKSKAQMKEARANLERRYKNMDEKTQNDIKENFKADPESVEEPDGAEDLLNNYRAAQRSVRQAEQNSATRFKNEVPDQLPKDSPSSDLPISGSNPNPDEDDSAPSDPEPPSDDGAVEQPAGSDAATVAETGAEEGAEVGGGAIAEDILGGSAAAQGFLDPISDILALGGLIGAAFGIGAHHSTPKTVAYSPLNPSIQHGI